MPESPEDLYARVVAQVGEGGRLPTPPIPEWDIFPWEVVDGRLVTKVLGAPLEREEPRWGESAAKPCGTCQEPDSERLIWRNERWKVSTMEKPGGLPMIVFLHSREHLDFTDLDDDMAAECGRITVWLSRIMSNLDHIGRVHVCKWGDGGSHLHVWFIARPERIPHLLGSTAVEWDEMLPPVPEDIWRADLKKVADRLAHHDGTALI